MEIEQVIEEVLTDAATSDWIKWGLRSALNRDPLDATNDAEMLFLILSQRLGELFADHEPPVNDCIPL